MFKKVMTSAVIATALLSGTALAGGPDMPKAPECEHCFKPFIGVNYSYLSGDTQVFNERTDFAYAGVLYNVTATGTIPDNFNGIGFEAGAKYGPYFGLAFGIAHYFKKLATVDVSASNPTPVTVTGTVGANIKFTNFYLEGRFYYPVTDGFNLIAAIGANLLDPYVTLSGNSLAFATALNGVLPLPVTNGVNLRNHLNWRFGAGLDYWFTPNWGVTAMYHYMPMPTSNLVTDLNDFWTVDAGIYYMFS